METTLAILMVLGIFIGIPAIIGFAVAGVYMLSARRVRHANHARVLGEAAQILNESQVNVGALSKRPVRVG